MFGNKANDGFLGGLFRSAASTASFLLGFVAIAYVITWLWQQFVKNPLRFMMWVVIILIANALITIYIDHKLEKDGFKQDNKPAQEYWDESMKNYDSERGY